MFGMSAPVLTLTLIAVFAFQPSGPPVPSQRDRNAETKQQTHLKSEAKPDSRGTEEAPIAERVLSGPPDQLKASQEEQDRKEKTIELWATIALGGLTILIGIGQIVMINKQANIAARQNEIIDTQTGIMRLQERAANSSAIAAKEQTAHLLASLEETRKATAAAITSANALKVIHRQWVKVERWTFQTWNVPSVGLHAEVSVEVSNRTPLPMTVFAVSTTLSGSAGLS